ncbi:MAG: type II 3-dehydroquinate dehydratase [Myxococcota bacterium]|nr:type II 3-dehydroquinate dehydratase [Myxococcota bacterium]
MKFLIVNGPNLNLLGSREPEVYGSESLDEIMNKTAAFATDNGVEIDSVQSHHEGVLIEAIQKAAGRFDGLIINPAGYGHSSVAIRDALIAVGLPAVEVHLSNLAQREEFRHRTLTADVCVGQICGFGGHGYPLAIMALKKHIAG